MFSQRCHLVRHKKVDVVQGGYLDGKIWVPDYRGDMRMTLETLPGNDVPEIRYVVIIKSYKSRVYFIMSKRVFDDYMR